MRIALALFVVAFLAVYFTFRQADVYDEFMETAEKTQGLVLKKEETIGNPKSKSKEHWVVYKYITRGRYSHTSREYVEYSDIWRGLQQGQKIGVYYNPKKPSQSYLAPVIERRLGIAGKR
ncbi:MAG: DUF3592 domain-containing protein [Rickettsiales bacterium]